MYIWTFIVRTQVFPKKNIYMTHVKSQKTLSYDLFL
jgi:hypothetical protein